METYPRISVITPSLNQGKYIEETINSVLGQSYPNLEYIVVDGGSTDQTLDILKKYDGQFQWISEQDRGQSHAINKGFRKATGDIIAFLNSDDVYEPGTLHRVAEYFTAHPQVPWVTGKCKIIGPRGGEIRKPITRYKNLWMKTRSLQVLLVLNYISQPATFWRKQVVDSIGEFDETLHYAMDYEYILRVACRYKIWVMDDTLASFRIHPYSKTGSSARKQFHYDLQIAKRYIDSPALVFLHGFHNTLTTSVYQVMMSLHSLLPH